MNLLKRLQITLGQLFLWASNLHQWRVLWQSSRDKELVKFHPLLHKQPLECSWKVKKFRMQWEFDQQQVSLVRSEWVLSSACTTLYPLQKGSFFLIDIIYTSHGPSFSQGSHWRMHQVEKNTSPVNETSRRARTKNSLQNHVMLLKLWNSVGLIISLRYRIVFKCSKLHLNSS